MAKNTYTAGTIFRVPCSRREREGRGGLSFEILGPGSAPNKKQCRVINDVSPSRMEDMHNFESEYSHEHLKKFAIQLAPEEAAELLGVQAEMRALRDEYYADGKSSEERDEIQTRLIALDSRQRAIGETAKPQKGRY